MATLRNPLDKADFDRIEEALKRSQELEQAINQAKSAGVDVGTRLEEARKARDRLVRLRNTYKPSNVQ